jgi:predicted branched-subunit amino acid permease
VEQIIIDESTAVGAAQPTVDDARRGFLAGGLGVYVAWNLGTLLGAIGGSALGDTDRWGLDAAFPAAFVALLAPHVRTHPGRVAAVTAAAICIATVPVLPAGIPVLLGAAGIIPAAWVARAGDGTSDGDTSDDGSET